MCLDLSGRVLMDPDRSLWNQVGLNGLDCSRLVPMNPDGSFRNLMGPDGSPQVPIYTEWSNVSQWVLVYPNGS
jgi:hypothetical protein